MPFGLSQGHAEHIFLVSLVDMLSMPLRESKRHWVPRGFGALRITTQKQAVKTQTDSSAACLSGFLLLASV